jgi:hypothetical protein
MQSARQQQAIDPAEVGIELERPVSGTGFSGVVHDVIARIGVWLYEVRSGSASPPRRRVARRTSFGGALLRIIVVLLLVGGVAGGALAWQYPRSEMVRMLVAEYAPQRVIDMMPAADMQDQSMEANAELRTTVGNTGSGYQVPGMDNGDANGNLSPMEQQQLIQKLARDVESLQQGIDQLRAGQDQMLRMMLRSPAPAQARAQVVPPRPAAAGTTGLAAGGGLPGLAPTTPPPPRRPAVPPPSRYFQ